MKKYEYKLLPIPVKSIWTWKIDEELLIGKLNEFGKQGWEAVVLSPSDISSKDRFIILKREIN